jgi:(p)ppGpp synthase/HD superfamily hydrolase
MTIIICNFISQLFNIINNNNVKSFTNNIATIEELVNSKLHYEDSITIKYEKRIKSHKRIIDKINRFRIPYDIYGLRIIYEDSIDISNTQFAYVIQDVLCSNFYNINCFYDDYIKYPKSNNYQSLHVYIFSALLIEVQIRNSIMNANAINGTASYYY